MKGIAMSRDLKAFIGDTKGNVAIMAVAVLTTILCMAALGIDLGRLFADRRKAQGAVDLAAIAAASNLTNATTAAAATIQQNNYPAGAVTNLVLGTYTANQTIPSSNRFQPSSAATANAAKVTLTTTTPLFFARLFTGTNNLSIQSTAIASQTTLASFAVGSGLVSLNGGILHQVLGGLLGANISLSAMSYQSLLSANVDLFSFMNALASRVNLTAGSYTTFLNSNVQLGTFINAMIDTEKAAYGSSSNVVQALNSIAAAIPGSSASIPLSSLLSLGPYSTLPLGQSPQVGVTVTAMDLLSAVAQLANGQNQVQVSLNASLPAGLASASLQLAIGQRPQGTSWVTVGAQGASVTTVQTRLLLTVQVLGSGSVASVNLPIYLQLASATATLNSISCGYPDISTSTVTLGVTPALLNAWIGNVSNYDFTNFRMAPNPGPANLVTVLAINVTGLAQASISNLAPASVNFSYTDIQQQNKKTVNTTDYLASLISSLIGGLSLGASIGGLTIDLPQPLLQSVSGVLATAATPVDQLLSGVLTTLGLGLGQADVWVTGIRCDGAVLVN
jgi:uncharacterized membrane protein